MAFVLRILAVMAATLIQSAVAQPVCQPNTNTPACQAPAQNFQPNDIMLGQQAHGPERPNQTVQVTPTQVLTAAGIATPASFGAIGDGQSHPLSGRYATLAAAQAVCPEATALTQEIDWCAMQAAIDQIAAKGPLSALTGTPGGAIRIPAQTAIKLGTTPLTANRISLTIYGDDQFSSSILIGGSPSLLFGLNNGMGIGSATIGSTGVDYQVGDENTLTGGTCADPPVTRVATVGSVGQIQIQTVTHAGSCAVQPPNPLAYTTSGSGSGAVFNGVWSGSGPYTLTGANVIAASGSGCVNGEVLTGVGGNTPPPGTTRPFKLTVTNAVAGAIQAGGVSITDAGSYGTPAPNPVSVTGSAACAGAAVNIGAFTNSGGSLTMRNLQLVADGQGVSIANAQFNLNTRAISLTDLIITAVNAGTTYFNGGFDLTSTTDAIIARVDAHNNLTFLNSNPSAALFVMHEQNNLLGHYGDVWDNVYVYGYMGGVIDYHSTSNLGYQGQKFHHILCVLGAHCLRLENDGGLAAYYNQLIDDLYGNQATQAIEITRALQITISNSGFGEGLTRVTSPPAQADAVVLDGVNEALLKNNNCHSSVSLTASITCFHFKGTSTLGQTSGNTIANAAHVPTFIGYVFDSGTSSNVQSNDVFTAGVTPVVNSGTNNATGIPQAPCVSPSPTLTNGAAWTIPDGTSCVYFDNTVIASATITLPANISANQIINFTAFAGITALTIQANTGQLLGAGMPTTITPALPFAVKAVSTRWQRI